MSPITVLALVGLVLALGVLNRANLVDACRGLFGRQRPVRIRIQRSSRVAGEAAAKHVSSRPFTQPAAKGFRKPIATDSQLAAALDDIGGTRLVSPNVVPGPWRIQ